MVVHLPKEGDTWESWLLLQSTFNFLLTWINFLYPLNLAWPNSFPCSTWPNSSFTWLNSTWPNFFIYPTWPDSFLHLTWPNSFFCCNLSNSSLHTSQPNLNPSVWWLDSSFHLIFIQHWNLHQVYIWPKKKVYFLALMDYIICQKFVFVETSGGLLLLVFFIWFSDLAISNKAYQGWYHHSINKRKL